MVQKFIIQTTKGRPDSLKHNVRIAITLTPERSYHGVASDPVAVASMTFSSHSEEYQELEWDKELAFGTYETVEHRGKNQCILKNERSPVVPLGMKSIVSEAQWRDVESQNISSTLSLAHVAGVSQDICLLKRTTFDYRPALVPILAWKSTSYVVGSSPEILLQAYVVDGAVSDGTILEANDRKRPLFPAPLLCEELPDSSTWRLTESEGGTIRLGRSNITSGQYTETGPPMQGAGILTNSQDDMKKTIGTLIKSLEETQKRLSAAEESIKALTGTTGDLARLETLIHSTQKQISIVDGSVTTIVDHRLPALERKTIDLEESLGNIQNQFSAARNTTVTTHDPVGNSSHGGPAGQATSEKLDTSVGQSQDRQSSADDSVRQVHRRLDALEKHLGWASDSASPLQVAGAQRQLMGSRPTQVQDSSTVANESLIAIRRQVAALDRRVPVMEAKLERVEKSVVLMERKVPAIEEKAIGAEKHFDKTEDKLGALQLSLGTAMDELGGLGSRVMTLEMKTSHLEEPWDQSRPTSPVVFASRSPDQL